MDDFADLKRGAKTESVSPRHEEPRVRSEKKSIEPRRPQTTSRPVRPPRDEAPTEQLPALTRLIASMKPSFLAKEEDADVARLLLLSSPASTDPLFLVKQDDTTLLIGSGFDTTQKAGKDYKTFPDMRLVASEKDRIRAWILLDEMIDVEVFMYILPTLDFPPVYATRDIIAKFRNSIKDASFLSKCRFFELFADGSTSRRIGDIECVESGDGLTLKMG